jgi:putative transcriptional regulator
MEEFQQGIGTAEFIELISGTNLNPDRLPDRRIYGCTVIDSPKAIISLNSSDYLKIYGWSTERALVFTDVHYGRSPMVAIRAHPLKPAMVVYLRPEKIDPLALKLSRIERIPLVSTDMNVEEIITKMRIMKEGV